MYPPLSFVILSPLISWYDTPPEHPTLLYSLQALFDPSLADVEGPGVSRAAFDAVQDVDVDNRRSLYGKVVLSGGGANFPVSDQCFHFELLSISPSWHGLS